jgi:NAD(P)H-nitrite reductase large subunit
MQDDQSVDGKTLICRCEEVSREEILMAIADGHHTLDSIKRALRAGMGACQGRSCGKLIMNILLEKGVQTTETITYGKARFPVVPCPVGHFSAGELN